MLKQWDIICDKYLTLEILPKFQNYTSIWLYLTVFWCLSKRGLHHKVNRTVLRSQLLSKRNIWFSKNESNKSILWCCTTKFCGTDESWRDPERRSHSFKEVKLLAGDEECGKLRVWKTTIVKGKIARRVLCCGNKFNLIFKEFLVTFQV